MSLEPDSNPDSNREKEGRIYIDFELVETVSIPPGARQFSFDIKTGDLATGQQLLTVNVDDLEDHVGSASLSLTGISHGLTSEQD